MTAIPGNAIYIVVGEMNIVGAAVKRSNRWSSQVHQQEEEQDSLARSFSQLKDVLLHVCDLSQVDFLSPFLAVVRSDSTSGPATGLALAALHKFLVYGLVCPSYGPASVENIADAVTHARFVGTDPSSDEVVLMKILQVLRALMLAPAGKLLSNEAVCEIMQSCFRICFEMRLSELLRKSAEHALTDMVQLLFSRLLQFSDDSKWTSNKKLKMRAVGMDSAKPGRRKRSPRSNQKKISSARTPPCEEPPGTETSSLQDSNELTPQSPTDDPPSPELPRSETKDFVEIQVEETLETYVNSQGVTFTSSGPKEMGLSTGPLVPHGLPCVRELFRFLVTLANPLDRHNSEVMVGIGLGLLTVAVETGAEAIGRFSCLMALVRDEASRNLLSLLKTEKLGLFTATLRLCLLLFEALRTHLKFQMEMFLQELIQLVVSENLKVQYEHKEVALDCIVQLWKVPGLVTELYLNYDCDQYCSNLFEDLAKLLSKNAFPVSGLYSTHLLSLEALLAVVEAIEARCHRRILTESSHLLASLQPAAAASSWIPPDPPTHLSGTDAEEAPAPQVLLGQQLSSGDSGDKKPMVRDNRMKTFSEVPTHEEIMAIKHKKKLLNAGTEQFNSQPARGIAFLQEHGLLSEPLNPAEVAGFLRDNPSVDKRMIGEYISNRKNLPVLEAFVRSFNFEETRIDEALRLYLETFRLPGEAPLISLLLEHFAEHWHKSNGQPFASNDAAFTLAYAVIMLNVDQHNHNVKKQNIPMTAEDFKKNLKKVNGGEDFDDEMLEEIYNSIKNEEIVMPAEQVGIVRENYLWKVLLRRGQGKEFHHVSTGLFDHDIFSLIWGPTVAALSFVFDKSTDPTVIQKATAGFRKCAMIAAHYGMSDVFDHLVISLCKFTALLSYSESPDLLAVGFGNSPKGQLAARTVFSLAHRHGDLLREGWRNLLDCLIQLYRARLLPQSMVEAEDFVHPKGVVSLVRESTPSTNSLSRMDSGILSSFYSYITQEAASQSGAEEELARQNALGCIQDCHPDQLLSESKFLRADSLQELVKTLSFICHNPDNPLDENCTVFLLELLTKIVLQNKDRVAVIWPTVRELLYTVVVDASLREQPFLLERSVVGLLRIAVRLARREEMIPQVVQCLRMLLLLKGPVLLGVGRQVSTALHELVRTGSIHSTQDWTVVFTLLECAGAGARPPRVLSGNRSPDSGAQSDSELGARHPDSGISSDRSYASDSEISGPAPPAASPLRSAQENTAGWIVVNKEGEIETVRMRPVNQFNIVYTRELLPHDPQAFLKSCETLTFLVRDAAHLTVDNFESCVYCIRTFVEASINCGLGNQEKKERRRGSARSSKEGKSSRKQHKSEEPLYDADDEDKNYSAMYQQVCHQLLDLMHTLHIKAAVIFQSCWTTDQVLQPRGSGRVDLWASCWCPLLQGIARLCCDVRRAVRTSALTFLQRALLVPDLQVLTPAEWESCFNKVLFPLLAQLLGPICPTDPAGMEETRVRAAALLSKVFLQHLTPLLSLPTFTALWLTILDFMDKYMHHGPTTDLLGEAVPESLKNMLLVMGTAGVFQPDSGPLWQVTWDRIDSFLPALRDDIIKPQQPPPPAVAVTPPPPVEAASPVEAVGTSPVVLHPPSFFVPQTLPVVLAPPEPAPLPP